MAYDSILFMKYFIYLLFVAISLSPLHGEVIKTSQIEDVMQEVDEQSLVFFNLAEVLMDTSDKLGHTSVAKVCAVTSFGRAS